MKQSILIKKLQKFLEIQINLRIKEAQNELIKTHSLEEDYHFDETWENWFTTLYQNICADYSLEEIEKANINELISKIPKPFEVDKSEKILGNLLQSLVILNTLTSNIEAGLCHGFSTIFAAKNMFGKDQKELWHKLRLILLSWDETENDLDREINWKFKKTKVSTIVEEILNQVVIDQVSVINLINNVNQSNYLSPNQCDLIKMSKKPDLLDLINAKNSQYILTDDELFYFDHIKYHLEKLNFFDEKTVLSLKKKLNFDTDREATKEDIEIIESYTGHAHINITNFEILNEGHLYNPIKEKKFVGNFDRIHNIITEESLIGSMCIIGGRKHETTIFYDEENSDYPWCIYDPNYENDDDETEEIQRFQFPSELIKCIREIHGNELTIRFVLLNKMGSKIQSNYPDIFDFDDKKLIKIQNRPKSLFKENGLELIVKLCPEFFSKVLDYWSETSNNDFIEEFIDFLKENNTNDMCNWQIISAYSTSGELSILSIISALKKTNLNNENGWCRLIWNYSGEPLVKLLSYLCQSPEYANQCLWGILAKDNYNLSGLDKLAYHRPDEVHLVLSLLLDKTNCYPTLEKILRLKIEHFGSDAKSDRSFQVGIIRGLLVSNLNKEVKDIIKEFCYTQAKIEKISRNKIFGKEKVHTDSFSRLAKEIDENKITFDAEYHLGFDYDLGGDFGAKKSN